MKGHACGSYANYPQVVATMSLISADNNWESNIDMP